MGHPAAIVYTIGYSGHTPQSFIDALHQADITLLLDIRMTPLSRKPGFSKNGLRLALAQAGISYEHLRGLGSPAPLRRQLALDKDYAAFLAHFAEHITTQDASLERAAHLVQTERVCLMCVEQHPNTCHRSVVADALRDYTPGPLTIVHLPGAADAQG